MKRHITLIAILALLLSGPVIFAAEPNPAVNDLVAKLPAEGIPAGRAAIADLAKLGPDAVKQVIAMVGGASDAKARFALNGLAFHVTRPGAETERLAFAKTMLDAFDAAPAASKPLLISLLQLTGKDESVPALAKLLDDADLHDAAAAAITRIATPAAVESLRKALPAVKDAHRTAIIRALGDLRDAAAAEAILPCAASPDTDVRRVALWALANGGAPAAAPVLAKAADAQGVLERAYATAQYLLYAQRLAEAGQKEPAARICRELARSRAKESNTVAGALRTLTIVLRDGAVDDVLAALDSEAIDLRAAALELLRTMGGSAATAKSIAKMQTASPAVRAELVTMLGRRGDLSALPAIIAAVKDKDKAVRLAAIPAAARLPNAQTIAALVAAMATPEADELKAIQDGLARMPGEEALAAVAAALPKAVGSAKVAILQVLAMRRAKAHVDVVLAAMADTDAPVRIAAIKALGDVGDASVLAAMTDALLKSAEDRDQAEVVAAMVRICQRMADAPARSKPLLDAMARAKGALRNRVLTALPQVGGQPALDAVLAEIGSPDEATVDAAVRALADWRDMSAAAHLLKVAADSAKVDRQVLAMRGYVRLVALPSGRSPAETAGLYKQGLGAARRPQEKKMVLAGLAAVRDVASLEVVAPCLDDPDLAEEAAAAAAAIILPKTERDRLLAGPAVAPAARKAIPLVKDAALKGRLRAAFPEPTIKP